MMNISKTGLAVMVAAILMAGCNNHKTSDPANENDSLAADTTLSENAVVDSTIYGTSTEDFGMSTFSMVTDNGDTLYVCRTANDGTDGEIYGGLVYGNRYALTTRDNGEAIGTLINLTELDQKLKDYRICNGKLVVKGDTVPVSKYLK